MKKGQILLILLFLLPLSAYPVQNPSPEIIQYVMDSQKYFISLYPFSEGSPNEKRLFEYITNYVESLNLDYSYSSLDKLDTDHSFSSNLIVHIPGQTGDRFILVIPLDSSSEDSTWNISLVLGMIRYWAVEPPPLSVTLLFTGADSRPDHPLGSMNFLEDFSFDNPSIVLYYSIDSLIRKVEVKGSFAGYSAPGWYMEKILSAAEKSGIPHFLDIPAILIDKTRINTGLYHPVSYFLSEDIPAVSLSGYGEKVEYGDERSLIKSHLVFINLFLESLSEWIPDEWEKNYIFVHFPDSAYSFISEKKIITIFLMFFAFSIIIPLFQERRVYLNFRKFRHQMWTVPVLVYLTFQFSLLSTLLIEEILVYRNLTELVVYYPLLFFLLKMSVILMLTRFVLSMMRGLPFPKSPHFYSYMAFSFALINVLLGTYLNISLSLFFLWILVFTILFVMARGKTRKNIFLYCSLLPVVIFLIFIFQKPYPSLYSFLLLSRVRGNMIITVFSLPFTSMITSLSFYHHHYEKSRHEVRAAVSTILWILVTIYLAYKIMSLQPYTEELPQKVVMQDVQNLDSGVREISVHSNARIGDGQLILFSNVLNLEDVDKELKIRGEIEKDLLQITSSSDVFLDRRAVRLDISAVLPPEKVQVQITSREPIVFYDCEFPYEILPGEKTANIFIGLNPPNPLSIPMIFSKDSKPDFSITLQYKESPYTLKLEKKPVQIESSMVLRKNISYQSIIATQ